MSQDQLPSQPVIEHTPLTAPGPPQAKIRKFGRSLSRRRAVPEQHPHGQRGSPDTLRAIIEACPLAIIGLAPDGCITHWNTGAEHLFGWTEAEVLGRPYPILPPDRHAEFEGFFTRALSGEVLTGVETYRQRRDGSLVAVSVCKAPIWAGDGRVVGVIAVVTDITARKQYEAEIARLAHSDPLTGTANRRAFYDVAEQSITAGQRTGEEGAILYLDLDRFKIINDSLGHEVGDRVLQQVAARLGAAISADGVLARLGGDEFGILLPRVGADRAIGVARRLIELFEQPVQVEAYRFHLSVSIGVVGFPHDGDSVAVLLKHADVAMYRAKTAGGGWQLYDPTLVHYTPERLRLEADLHQAIDAQQLWMAYQPIRHLPSGQIAGFEALIRWEHPELGAIAPGVFIPIAEESALIRKLDRWVLRAALEQSAAWQRAGQPATIWVNLSRASLADEGLVAYMRACLVRAGVRADTLVVEVTESAVMHEPELACRVLTDVAALGARVAIDDMGSGYTSLAHLKLLPVQMMKIDRSLTHGIGADPKGEGVLRALLALGAGLGFDVVIEGVETQQQLEWLRAQGCVYAQGYYLGCPERASAPTDPPALSSGCDPAALWNLTV